MNTVSQRIVSSYEEIPDKPAVHLLFSQEPDYHLTYRGLFQQAVNYTHALHDVGIEKGEVVILILQHGIDLIASFFGSILGGAVPSIMPFLTEKLRPEIYRSSLSALFEITKPAGVITYAGFENEVLKAINGTSVRALLISEQINKACSMEDSSNYQLLTGLNCDPEDIVLLQHSSGTTGLQKGVALSHQAVFNQLASYSEALHLHSNDVIVSWLPLYHDMGLIAGFILPILKQIPLVLISPFDWVRAPQRLMHAISDYQGTLCWLPNFAYNFCAQKIRERHMEGVDLTSLRSVINCSEPMHWKSHQLFLERFEPYGFYPRALGTSYAMAENVFAVTQGGIDSPVRIDVIDQHSFSADQIAQPAFRSKNTKMVSAGKPIPNVQICVLDNEGNQLPDRHIGEIALKSNSMLSGYYRRPDLTAQAFQDGWYLTGDLGYLADGELFITGRKKDLIIVGGKNIYPQDLERLVDGVSGVHPGRVVAFGIFNESSGTEDVVMIAESEFEFDPSDREDPRIVKIASELREQVTTGSDIALRYAYIVPHNWLIKTSSGKIARDANRQKYLRVLNE